MALASWPAYSDDSGTKTDGTIVDAALLDDIKQAIIDDIVSATNPAEVLADIIDEIVDARGSEASLDARLDEALNEDGTLKAIAGQATETQLSNQLGARNLIFNSDLLHWPVSASAAPAGYTLAGAGAAVARTGAGESDTTHVGGGLFTAKVTSGGGAAATLTTTPRSAAIVTLESKIQGKTVVLSTLVKASAGSVARIIVDDGVSTSASSYHTGDGTVQLLSVSRTLSGSATKIDCYLEVAAGANVAYVSGLQLFESSLQRSSWLAEDSPWDSKEVRRLATFDAENGSTGYYSVATGNEEAAWTLPGGIPANAIKPGQGLRMRFTVKLAGNTNSRQVKLYVGTNSLSIAATTTATDVYYIMDVTIMRASATTAALQGYLKYLTSTGADGTVVRAAFGDGAYLLTVDWTTSQVLKIALDGVAAADLVLLNGGVVEYLP